MICYFDTSALVPLLVTEPASPACRRLWDDADDVATCRISYAEASAALAQAHRFERLSDDSYAAALANLDTLWMDLGLVEVDDQLVHTAGSHARQYALRGYDAVHCAAAHLLDDADLVAAAGDHQLIAAWRELGIATFDTNNQPA